MVSATEIEKLQKQVEFYRKLYKNAAEREKLWQERYYKLLDGLLNLVNNTTSARKEAEHEQEAGCDRTSSLCD